MPFSMIRMNLCNDPFALFADSRAFFNDSHAFLNDSHAFFNGSHALSMIGMPFSMICMPYSMIRMPLCNGSHAFFKRGANEEAELEERERRMVGEIPVNS